MRNQLEERLSRLEAPAPPQNLKDRCMNTIPSTAKAKLHPLQKKARPFTLRRAAIAGALMFWFGSGPIRGFAVVLMIGIATSYFTSVTVVRMLVARWFRRSRPRELVL